MNFAALRIDAGHDVLDDAVLAGGIHALQHHEHGPAAVRVKPLLHVGEPADAVGEDRLHLIDIGREAECLRGIVIGEPEMPRLVDPAGFENFCKLHRRLAGRARFIAARPFQDTPSENAACPHPDPQGSAQCGSRKIPAAFRLPNSA